MCLVLTPTRKLPPVCCIIVSILLEYLQDHSRAISAIRLIFVVLGMVRLLWVHRGHYTDNKYFYTSHRIQNTDDTLNTDIHRKYTYLIQSYLEYRHTQYRHTYNTYILNTTIHKIHTYLIQSYIEYRHTQYSHT